MNSDAIEKSIEDALCIVKKSYQGSVFAKELIFALSQPGKRLRPKLCLSVLSDLGQPVGETQSVAALALEFIHLSSLIHDDLPALDNDAWRRGRPSCHVAFGEAPAILLGDILVGLAFQLIAGTELTANIKSELNRALSEAFVMLCEGQKMDLGCVENLKSEQIFARKTGALFACATEFAACMAGVVITSQKKHLKAMGEHIGLLYQVLDDQQDKDLSPDQSGELLELAKAHKAALKEEISQATRLGLDPKNTNHFLALVFGDF